MQGPVTGTCSVCFRRNVRWGQRRSSEKHAMGRTLYRKYSRERRIFTVLAVQDRQLMGGRRIRAETLNRPTLLRPHSAMRFVIDLTKPAPSHPSHFVFHNSVHNRPSEAPHLSARCYRLSLAPCLSAIPSVALRVWAWSMMPKPTGRRPTTAARSLSRSRNPPSTS